MPINTSPDALDAFDALDDNDKSSLIDEMDDNDATNLASAMDTHRASKMKATAGVPVVTARVPDAGMQVGAPTINTPAMAPPVVPPLPPPGVFERIRTFAADAQKRAADAGSPFDTGSYQTPMSAVRNLDATKAAFVDPAIRWTQENVMRPGFNQMFKEGGGDGPVLELAKRSAIQWLTGPGIMDDMDEKKRIKAVNDLEDVFRHPAAKTLFDDLSAKLPQSIQEYIPNTPEKKAAMVLGVADQVGQAPLLFVGGGKVAEYSAAGKTFVSRVAGHGVASALALSAQALVHPGAKLSDAAKTGFLMGAGPAALGEAAGAVGKAVAKSMKPKEQVIGVGLTGFIDDIISELNAPVTPAQRKATIDFADQASKDMKAVMAPPPEFQAAKITDPNFKPGMAFVTPAPEQGFVGKMAQVKDGQAFIYERPINNLEDAQNFMKEIAGKKVPNPLLDEKLQGSYGYSDEMASTLGFKKRTKDWLKQPKEELGGPRTNPGKGQAAEPLPLDSPPPDNANKPVLVVRDADGIKLKHLDDTPIADRTFVNENSLVPTGGHMVQPSGREVPLFMQPERMRGGGPPVRDSTPTGVMPAAGAPPAAPPPFKPPDEPPRFPPPGPGEMPDHDFNAAKNIAGMVKVETKTPGVFDKVMRQLVGSHVRGPKDLAQLAAIQKGVKHLESSGIETVKALQRNFGKKLLTDLDRDLMKLAKAPTEGERILLSQEMGNKPYGQLWNKHKEKVHDLLRERDILDQTISALGGIPDDLTALRQEGQIDAYVSRSFMAYILPPGRWAEIVKRDSDLMNKGIAWLRSEHGLEASDKSMDGDLQAKLLDIIGSNDPIASMKDQKYGIKSSNNLKKREDLSPVLKELLGENKSGALAIGQSLGTQRAVVANLGMWREIAARPDWCLETLGDNPALAEAGWKQLPNNRRWYGDAAGKFLNPQVYDTMVTLPNTIENSKFLFAGLMSYVKANEVALGGSGPWLNNTVANIFSSIKSGGIDPLGSPLASGKAMARAAKAMADFRANPSSMHGDAGLILDARRVGVEAPGYHGTEVDPLQKQLTDTLMKQYSKAGDKSYFSYLRIFGDTVKAVRKPAGILFDQNDRFFKLANWIALYEKFKASPERYLQGVAPQGIDEAAKRLAAYRVNRSFQSADKLGPAVDKVRKGAPGVLAKYWTPFAEDLRIAGDIPAHVAEEPELALRMFKYAVAMGAVAGTSGMARRESGIPDEECDAALALAKGQRHGPAAMNWCLPWRDAKGRAQIWDLTTHVPIAKFFEGSPDQGMFSKVLTNAGLQATSGGAGQDLVAGVAAQAGVPGLPNQSFYQPRPGEEGVLSAMNYAWNTLSLGPKAVTKEYDILKRAGALGGVPNTQESFTPGQAAARTMGSRIEPFTLPGNGPSPTGYANVKATVGMLGQLRSQFPAIAQMPDDQAMAMLPQLLKSLEGDPRRFKDVRIKATIDQIKEVLGRWKAQGDAVRKAKAAKSTLPK